MGERWRYFWARVDWMEVGVEAVTVACVLLVVIGMELLWEVLHHGGRGGGDQKGRGWR